MQVTQEFTVQVTVSDEDGIPGVRIAADDEVRGMTPDLFAELALAAALGLMRTAALSSSKGTEGFLEHAEAQVRGLLSSRVTDIRFEDEE